MTIHTPIEPHEVHSERLMNQAREELAKLDRVQAGEKAWGAFSHALKVIADERGWAYDSHSQLWPIIQALVEESDDPQLRLQAIVAEHLHTNYYRDIRRVEDVAQDLVEVASALARLREIRRRYAEDADYRRQADALRPPHSRYDVRRRRWLHEPPASPAAQPPGGPPPDNGSAQPPPPNPNGGNPG